MRGRGLCWTLLLAASAPALAGCLEGGTEAGQAGPEEDEAARIAREGARAEAEGPEPVLLGDRAGGTSPPGRITFTVDVPVGGATDVAWGLVISPAGSSLDFVEGPGCSSSGNSVIIVGGSTQTDGACSDLEPGSHEFAAVLLSPVLAFHAQVIGITEASAAASNATET